jgi:hypothetical protein
VLRRHIWQSVGVGGFAVQPHLGFDNHVTVQQAANAHQHDALWAAIANLLLSLLCNHPASGSRGVVGP